MWDGLSYLAFTVAHRVKTNAEFFGLGGGGQPLGDPEIRSYRVGPSPKLEPPCVADQDRCANAAVGPAVALSASPRSMAAIRPEFTVNT